MSTVFDPIYRKTVRGPVNYLDKCTIVSIYPKTITQEYVTVDPPKYEIPAGSNDDPGVLVVSSASTWQDPDPERPLIEVVIPSVVMAQAIVRDYGNGIYGRDQGSIGLFYVVGEFSSYEIKTKFTTELDKAIAQQRNWYSYLVRMADSLWARSNGNTLAILDDMRLAAKELGLLDKDWMQDVQAIEKVRCQACGTLKDPKYPICPNCKYGDAEAVKRLGLVAT